VASSCCQNTIKTENKTIVEKIITGISCHATRNHRLILKEINSSALIFSLRNNYLKMSTEMVGINNLVKLDNKVLNSATKGVFITSIAVISPIFKLNPLSHL
jgi:hypothetical protein